MAKLKLVKPYRLTLTSNHMLAENYSQKRKTVILKQQWHSLKPEQQITRIGEASISCPQLVSFFFFPLVSFLANLIHFLICTLVPVDQLKSEQVKFAAALMSRVRQKYSSYTYVIQPNAIDHLVSLNHSRSYLHLFLIFSQKAKKSPFLPSGIILSQLPSSLLLVAPTLEITGNPLESDTWLCYTRCSLNFHPKMNWD